MPMVLIRADPDTGLRFNPADLRSRLFEGFPGIEFDAEEQFSKKLKLIRDLPKSSQPPKFIIDDIERTASSCGLAYAFEIDADGVLIQGNVRSVDAVFLMDTMPPSYYWESILNFAESIDGGVVTTQFN